MKWSVTWATHTSGIKKCVRLSGNGAKQESFKTWPRATNQDYRLQSHCGNPVILIFFLSSLLLYQVLFPVILDNWMLRLSNDKFFFFHPFQFKHLEK